MADSLREGPTAGRGAFLDHGFRPFFLLGALWAAGTIGLWVAAFSGHVTLPSAFDPLAWHRHELLFGAVGAIIAGFLLTAVPNWAGGPFLAGRPLGGLVLVWLAARMSATFSGWVGPYAGAILDAAFFLLLAGWAVRRILKSANRNVPIPILIALLGFAAAADHLSVFGFGEAADLAYRSALAIVLSLVSLIGGRIVPAFTRNWLSAQSAGGAMPVSFNRYDGITLGSTVLALAAWVIGPESAAIGGLLLLAGLLHAVRLVRWAGWRTGAEPLLAALHLGYAWLPIGLVLLGLSILDVGVARATGIHALTAGALGTMTLAVMTRASLGHTGRALTAGPGTIAIFLAVHLGAALRVAAPVWPDSYLLAVAISGSLWAGAYLLFAVIYGPWLVRPALSS